MLLALSPVAALGRGARCASWSPPALGGADRARARAARTRGRASARTCSSRVGSALFTIVSAYAWSDGLPRQRRRRRLDPTRIAAQIVTGIGFLGAGAIIRQGLTVRGLTTAATLWVVAAIGMAAGAGYYCGAVIATRRSCWSRSGRCGSSRTSSRRASAPRRAGCSRRARRPAASAAGARTALERIGGRLALGRDRRRAPTGGPCCWTSRFRRAPTRRAIVAELAELEDVRSVRWTD